MDRSRVLFPSLSFVAHVTGAAVLATVPLFTPESLPTDSGWGTRPPTVDLVFAASLGRGGAVSSGRRAPQVPRVEPPRMVVPTNPVSTPSEPTPIQLDVGGPVIPGLPDEDGSGDGNETGFCVANCGGGGPTVGSGYVPPEAVDASRGGPVRPGGDIREPVKVRHVAPEYPTLAIAGHVQGRVILDAVIDDEGRVSSVTVLKSVPLLDAAAVAAVRQWRYRPTLLNGIRVSVLLTVTVEFRLR